MRNKFIKITIIILIFVLGLVIGFTIAAKVFSTALNNQNRDTITATQSQNKIWNSMIIKNINGLVEKIDNNKLTVKITLAEPLVGSNSNEKTVDIDGNTKFFQLTQKDSKEYQKEIANFQESIKAPTAVQTTQPPIPFNKTQINFSDIKPNQQVLITSASDIKNAQEFKATEIDILPDVGQSSNTGN